jgi:hypothetical protein
MVANKEYLNGWRETSLFDTPEQWGEFVGLGIWLNIQDRSKMKTNFEMVSTIDCVRIQRTSQVLMTLVL